MQFPKLTPLQARLAASLAGTAALIFIYLSFLQGRFAYAAELASTLNQDHNHHRLAEAQLELEVDSDSDSNFEREDHDTLSYEPSFPGLERWIIGRQEEGTDMLQNNVAERKTLEPNGTIFFQFGGPSTSPMFITINVCSQPIPSDNSSSDIPSLKLYVSTSDENPKPGPSNNAGTNDPIEFIQGFAASNITSSRAAYLGISAPDMAQSGMIGGWSVEVAASTDKPYHGWHDAVASWDVMDTDANSALLLSGPLTANNQTESDEFRRIMDGPTEFTMFAFPTNSDTVRGMERSYCALSTASVEMNVQTSDGMTNRGPDRTPKQQVYLQGLNASTIYDGYWARKAGGTSGEEAEAGSIPGGGGQVWKAKAFNTTSDGNCQVIFNLTFCSEVAYAVPSNNNSFNSSALAQLYDDNARQAYQGFNYSLQQIPCDAPNVAQYSLARNCTHCANDYKNWLCAVSIPRCRDLSDNATYLGLRNLASNFVNGSSLPSDSPYANQELKNRRATNQSRNTFIDSMIKPGPYKELLPCQDLCYSLVRSCPAAFGFSCPTEGEMMDLSYGKERECNDPSGLFNPNAGVVLNHDVLMSVGPLLLSILFHLAL